MIEINLLPKELRVTRKLFVLNKELYISVGLGAGVILLAFFLFLLAIVGGQQMVLTRTEKELNRLDSDRKLIQQLKTDIRFLQSQSQTADGLVKYPLLWSKKMNQTSDLLQAGIWLTKLELQRRSISTEKQEIKEEAVLFIQGRVYSRDREEAAIVGKYISALKGNEDFFKDFEDIRLENIQSRPLGAVSVSEFMLVCPLKAKEKKSSG
jgi:Tfp pilus assembly protein PilN